MVLQAYYDPRVIYVARRHITVAGKEYKQGEAVPREGVSEMEYHQMFARRKIVLPYANAVQSPAPSEGNAAAPSAPSADSEVTIDDPAGGLVPKAKGWFAVWHGGKLVRNVRGEDAANKLLAELRGESAASPEGEASGTPQDAPESGGSAVSPDENDGLEPELEIEDEVDAVGADGEDAPAPVPGGDAWHDEKTEAV